jgi:hypothetical protein
MKRIGTWFVTGSVLWSSFCYGEDLRELVRQTAAAKGAFRGSYALFTEEDAARVRGDAYRITRDKIVALGQGAVPELQELRDSINSPWQERVIAGVCLERIQHMDKINAFAQHDWRAEPDLRGAPGWQSRSGMPRGFFAVAEKRWGETGLRYHLLQLMWKGVGEMPKIAGRDQWEGWAREYLKKQADPYLLHVARALVRAVTVPEDIAFGHANDYYQYLHQVRDHDSLPLMFDLWIDYRNAYWPQKFEAINRYNKNAEQSRRNTDSSFDEWMAGLLEMARPEDAVWIAAKLKDVPLGERGRGYLAAYLEKCDTTPPVITLRGGNPVTIECGGAYADTGATATDNKDGNITSRIVVENNVDTPKVGTYQVIYRVTDAAGNAATATRTVKVVYKFDGFLAPVGGADATGGNYANPVRTFKLGSTIPVKFKISCGGAAVKDGAHTLQVIKYNNETTAAEPIDATPTDAATTGNQFKLAGDDWHFNLDTKATGMSVGTWQLKATLSDGSVHIVWIGLK